MWGSRHKNRDKFYNAHAMIWGPMSTQKDDRDLCSQSIDCVISYTYKLSTIATNKYTKHNCCKIRMNGRSLKLALYITANILKNKWLCMAIYSWHCERTRLVNKLIWEYQGMISIRMLPYYLIGEILMHVPHFGGCNHTMNSISIT